eukprot:3637484-Prymnesium_polylepis.1
MASKPLAPPKAPPGGWAGPPADLLAMAQVIGAPAPAAGPWLQMFTAVAEASAQPIVISDMKTPGLPITWCNRATTALTGYAREQMVGRNCRFLQGKATEAGPLRAMIGSIRRAEQLTVRVTNYKQGGDPFVNALTLSPVRDSAGEYRYSIGVLSDAARDADEATCAAEGG